jgi:FtsP/CotA-like multicopper oxidase with cupredoxin domain
MKVYAFAEEDGQLQVPGPLIRVPEGTEIHLIVRNQLPVKAVLHGLHSHPGDGKVGDELAPNETREWRFPAGAPGTYEYYASAGSDLTRSDHGRPFGQDSQLTGAVIVDPRSGAAADRVFVITLWRSGTDFGDKPAHQVAVINGKSWPYTERLTYTADERTSRCDGDGSMPATLHILCTYMDLTSVSTVQAMARPIMHFLQENSRWLTLIG